MNAAPCAKASRPDRWFPAANPGSSAHAAQTLFARRACVTCPLNEACHELAMKNRRTVGIFAGLDEAERRHLKTTGTSPGDYDYCDKGLHLMLPPNTGTKGNCLPCRRIRRAVRQAASAAPVEMLRIPNPQGARRLEVAA